ncbi:hypothetical protein OEZ86_008031 [Tetradesmus obliquus]|nr:hypothetical protein OEZ86_008031 [Tetradesmus obliquus]
MCTLGFADMYSYSMADAFLGQVLAAGGAGSADVMLALGIDGVATCVMAVVVLLCQSFPAISGMALRPKWWLVIAGQAASVASSALPAVLPCMPVITACRAFHGAATAGCGCSVRSICPGGIPLTLACCSAADAPPGCCSLPAHGG